MGYLGDVTTPTGGGAGIFSQIYSWFTGSVANAANEPQIVQDWMAQVRQRGNTVLRYPKTDNVGTAGDLAEREANTDDSGAVIGYNYYLAPLDVINADRTTRGLSLLAPATAKIAAAGEGLGQGLQSTIVKGALLIGGALVLSNVLTGYVTRRRS